MILPILRPGIIGVALFGFTLSYDEFAAHAADGRRAQHAAARDLGHDHQRHLAGALRARHGHHRALFLVIALALGSIALIQRAARAGGTAGEAGA